MKTELLIKMLTTGLMVSSMTLTQVRRNNPYLSKKYSEEVAVSIDKYAKEYKIPPNIIAAIFMVESGYKLNSINKASSDYGIGQVNEYNIRAYKLDKMRLLTDLDYSVKWGVHVFAWFYKKYPLDTAIKRYNCGTRPSCVRIKSVKRYLRLVKKYL